MVEFSTSYEGEGRTTHSETVEYLYYETPVLSGAEPACGPTTGYTQLTVRGQNFADMGFGKVKCVFNGTTFMNATILDEHTIKCSSPPLTVNQAALEPAYAFHQVAVTLNGRELTQELIRFSYYPELRLDAVEESNLGPISGGTNS